MKSVAYNKSRIALVLTALLLNTCSSAPGDSKYGNGAGGKKSIALWHIQVVGEGPKMIQQSIDRFKADNPNVNVEVVPINNDAYKTKIKVAIGAGNAPCVFPTWGGGPLREYVKGNQILDLTPYMTKDNYRTRFLDASFTAVTFDDKVYGVPVENVSLAVIFYNKAIFEKYGLTPPATYDDLLKLVHTLKGKGIAPFALANKTKWPGSMFFMYLVDRMAGNQPFAKAAARQGTFEAPVFVEAGKRIQELVKAGAFQDGFNGLDYDTGGMRALLYSGKAAMELMGTWEIGTFKTENADFFNKNLGFFPFPAVSGGLGNPKDIVGTVGNNFYSIPSTCKNPDEAFKLIQYLIDDKAVEVRGAAGRVPPVKGFKTADPVLQQVIGLVEQASNVQLWYDQYLPPSVAEAHKDTSQTLFGLSMTPEEAAKKLEQAAQEYKE